MNRACPWCRYAVDCATPLDDGQAPQPGDQLICIACGEWGIEAEGGTIRRPSDIELAEIAATPICRRVRAAWVRMKEAQAH